ncbi:MAG: ribulose-phosphate 3-epimerase [Clostridia bacterium]|nr:ribulose-phosphate 3-epimerase [Clostridia bacterium]
MVKSLVKISPSILSVPIELVPEKINKVEKNIDYIHIDVMDGKFVSNKTNGIEMFLAGKKSSDKPLDVHLMVENPIKEIEKYKGAEIITFHIEAVKSEEEVLEIIEKIHSLGAKAGISIKPNTDVKSIKRYLDEIELVLVMSVEPGYGGQKLIPETLEKISLLRNAGFEGLIEVDGGINLDNCKVVKEYDIDIIVAGTAIFSALDENEAILKIK